MLGAWWAVLSLQLLCAGTDSRVDLDSTGSETCSSTDAAQCRRPTWRVVPYKKEREKVYGGQYVADAFKKYFDGPVETDDWDLLWTRDKQVAQILQRNLPLREGRMVNNCRYFRAAGQKCYFAGHVRRVVKALNRDPDLASQFAHLKTYVLNHREQAADWLMEVAAHPERPWVLKQCNAGLSAGIELLSGAELLSAARRWATRPENSPVGKFPWSVAQEFMQRPYMGFGGSKFHLRVYVLVTRWGPPPSVFVFDEGVVFRSRQRYQQENLSLERDIFSAIGEGVEGLSHSTLWAALDAKSAARQAKAAVAQLPSSAEVRSRMMFAIRAIFGEALEESFGEAIKETRTEQSGFACFDLFGLDVMFDEELRPYILEVNFGPNLQVDDRGEESEGLLGRIKAPLIEQLAHWASLYARRAPRADSDASAIEEEALLNFTRVL